MGKKVILPEFRVWDNIDNKMLYKEDLENSRKFLALGLHGLPVVVDIDSFKGDEVVGWNVDHNRFVMMKAHQQDSLGTELFEGDVIIAPHDFGLGGFDERVFTVYDVLSPKGMEWQYWDMSKSRLLGNKYQHPELQEFAVNFNERKEGRDE